MISKDFLNLAGEYRVCAELLKRSLFATITYGNEKGVDIFAIGENRRRIAVIEVKSSNSTRFLTKLYQKYPDPNALRPDFWVLYSIRDTGRDAFEEHFFILSHSELAVVQAKRNKPDADHSYEEAADYVRSGVNNVLIDHVKQYENQWSKIIEFCAAP